MAVHFRDLGLPSHKIIQFWREHLSDYPEATDQPPYAPEIEAFGSGVDFAQIQARFALGAPPARHWFAGEDTVVQIQTDWLAQNWRRDPAKPEYVHYPVRRERFQSLLRDFSAFVGLPGDQLPVVQSEVTYINLVPLSADDLAAGPLGQVLVDVRPSDHPDLGVAEAASLQMSYTDHPRADGMQARLRIVANRVDPPGMGPAVHLTLSVRGRSNLPGIDGILAVTDLGHEWIVRGFKSLTEPVMWERWGLVEGGQDVAR